MTQKDAIAEIRDIYPDFVAETILLMVPKGRCPGSGCINQRPKGKVLCHDCLKRIGADAAPILKVP
jgi:hypothetical protein